MKYFSIPMEVNAIQVPVDMSVSSGDTTISLEAGDWLVFEPDGTAMSYDTKEFRQRFRCAEETTGLPKVRKPRQKKVQLAEVAAEEV